MGGIDFLVHEQIEHMVTKYCAISESVICLILKLNNRHSNNLETNNLENSFYPIISGDFNAVIEEKQLADTEYIGNFGLGTRSHKGDMLLKYLNQEKLYCLKTF